MLAGSHLLWPIVPEDVRRLQAWQPRKDGQERQHDQRLDDTMPPRVYGLCTQAGQNCIYESADECQNWAKSHSTQPASASYDHPPSTCASAASVSGTQKVMTARNGAPCVTPRASRDRRRECARPPDLAPSPRQRSASPAHTPGSG